MNKMLYNIKNNTFNKCIFDIKSSDTGCLLWKYIFKNSENSLDSLSMNIEMSILFETALLTRLACCDTIMETE